MTRVNTVDPSELYDQHLAAEAVEILMICSNLKRTLRSRAGFQPKKVPPTYRMGAGHVYFFYNKGRYLYRRFQSIQDEMLNRGMSPEAEFPIEVWPNSLFNDWEPNEAAIAVSRERIAERVSQKPGWYRYYGELID